jgi:hypothetical protein
MNAVKTIHDHYARQASPEVWTEVDALRQRAAVLESALERQWHPIDTAPKDGTPLLLFAADGRIGLGYFEPQEFDGCKWTNQSAAWIGLENGRVRLVFGGLEPEDATHWTLPPGPPRDSGRLANGDDNAR